jgi:hypothetical protein
VQRLVRDRTPGWINAPESELRELAFGVAEARADGYNPRTGSKDLFALREFEAFAELRGFDPNLQSEWTRRFPEREEIKFGGYLLFRSQRARGRARGDLFAKPMSIYQNYLALRRVFKGRSVEIPPSARVREALRGLIKRFVRRMGIERLRPRRVEPITPSIVQLVVQMLYRATVRVHGVVWAWRNWVAFIVTAWMVINLQVGSRKGESTKLPGDVDQNDWFTRGSLSWRIDGRVVTDPTEQQLDALVTGRDIARLAPKGAKCDAFGTCHGTEPIVLPYHDHDGNPAWWLAQIERRWPCHGAERGTLPLFCDDKGGVFTDARFGALIMEALVAVLGRARAALFSPHSWRVWLASALRMANASDGLIMAFGRWLNPDSVKIYARLTTEEYGRWMNKIMTIKHIDAARTTSLPPMELAEMMGAWQEFLGDKEPHREREGADTFDAEAARQAQHVAPALTRGTRVSVYWTEMEEWYAATVTSTRKVTGDDGRAQRDTHVMYDAVGPWRTKQQLAYWHCLDDEQWRLEEGGQ